MLVELGGSDIAVWDFHDRSVISRIWIIAAFM